MNSEVNYETAWKRLKSIVMEFKESSIKISEIDSVIPLIRHRAYGGKLLAEQILHRMEMIEKEMTTAGQDDDQQAQD